MSKEIPIIQQDVNKLIIEKLRSYPETVADIAIKAIQLSESLSELDVIDTLNGLIREIARKQGGSEV